ncbi:hypothetical protein B0T18DRAFT_422538 [Schizothecium vesticola]|uniref:Histone chaperone domain-containing protein n=1 Tax=Schizothecium vesticola TaxID=314040 RepID=A0AA40EIK8_9PEZI|nr:hypothetical protein B0T18DRAFT_422538 [Schizothecium vesticola]
MSKTAHPYADDKPGAELPEDAPTGQVNDPSYKTSGDETVPVVDDDAPVEDPVGGLGDADSDKQLERDEKEAIDPGNIIKDKSRIGKPGRTLGRYTEPGDEDFGLIE